MRRFPNTDDGLLRAKMEKSSFKEEKRGAELARGAKTARRLPCGDTHRRRSCWKQRRKDLNVILRRHVKTEQLRKN